MKPTLMILAAGMGSRYGGLKQMDSMGPSGETLMDYSVYDALQAGFGKVVFVIRKDIEADFREMFVDKIGKHMLVEYVIQDLHDLPEDYKVPEGRQKPWGTGHAILAAREVIKEPFAVINADDFYGRDAFVVMADYLSKQPVEGTDYCMVGYPLVNTLSEHGTVNRGVCHVNQQGHLVEVNERIGLGWQDNTVGFEQDGQWVEVLPRTIVSMNMWGFTPKYFEQSQADFIRFLQAHGNELKSEFFIPSTVSKLIQEEACTVTVLKTSAKWFGITYQEDRVATVAKMQEMVAAGEYPEKLW
ncbi:MAG: nucleotidyltransferase [Bacteroidales bacterium]